jgi:hypothetical protein
MKLVIALTHHEPPTGTVEIDGSSPVPFAGWLGLMTLLGDVVDQASIPDVTGSALRTDATRSAGDESEKVGDQGLSQAGSGHPGARS